MSPVKINFILFYLAFFTTPSFNVWQALALSIVLTASQVLKFRVGRTFGSGCEAIAGSARWLFFCRSVAPKSKFTMLALVTGRFVDAFEALAGDPRTKDIRFFKL
jgi:hypothetical protein